MPQGEDAKQNWESGRRRKEKITKLSYLFLDFFFCESSSSKKKENEERMRKLFVQKKLFAPAKVSSVHRVAFSVLVRFSTILFKYDVVLVVPDLKAKQ